MLKYLSKLLLSLLIFVLSINFLTAATVCNAQLIPHSYNLLLQFNSTFSDDIETARFYGSATIRFQLTEPTYTIALDTSKLSEFENVTLYKSDMTFITSNFRATFRLFEVTSSKLISPGEYILIIER